MSLVCYTKVVRNSGTDKTNEVDEMLATLTGTPKQVAWAETIRERKFLEMQAHHSEQRVRIADYEYEGTEKYTGEQVKQIVMDTLDNCVVKAYALYESKAPASFWIDVRNWKAYEIINKYSRPFPSRFTACPKYRG